MNEHLPPLVLRERLRTRFYNSIFKKQRLILHFQPYLSYNTDESQLHAQDFFLKLILLNGRNYGPRLKRLSSWIDIEIRYNNDYHCFWNTTDKIWHPDFFPYRLENVVILIYVLVGYFVACLRILFYGASAACFLSVRLVIGA